MMMIFMEFGVFGVCVFGNFVSSWHYLFRIGKYYAIVLAICRLVVAFARIADSA